MPQARVLHVHYHFLSEEKAPLDCQDFRQVGGEAVTGCRGEAETETLSLMFGYLVGFPCWPHSTQEMQDPEVWARSGGIGSVAGAERYIYCASNS